METEWKGVPGIFWGAGKCSIYQELDKQGLCENWELCLKVINQLKSCLKKRRTGIPYGLANLTLVLEQLLHVCTGRGMHTRNNPHVHKQNRYIVVDSHDAILHSREIIQCNITQQGKLMDQSFRQQHKFMWKTSMLRERSKLHKNTNNVI